MAPRASWRRMMVPGHCYCEPAHYGNAGFMVGVLLTGLKWHHLETGDPRVDPANDTWDKYPYFGGRVVDEQGNLPNAP